MKFVALILLAVAAWSQPTSSTTLNFQSAYGGYTPHGQAITYNGTLTASSAGSCPNYALSWDTSTPGKAWLRLLNFNTPSVLKAVGTYSGCTGTSLTISGTTYPISTSHTVVRNNLNTWAFPTSTPTTVPAICSGAILALPRPRYFGYDTACEDPNRRPGGTFTMPAVGSTYVDPIGTTVKVIAQGDGNHYASISPFNHDSTLVMGDSGIYRISDAVKVVSFPTDTVFDGNCWFEIALGYQDKLTCMEGRLPIYGGLGRIMRYTLPNLQTCGAFPCAMASGTEIYRAQGTGTGVVDGVGAAAPYNMVSKGGSSGSTSDGWNIWSEIRLNGYSYARTGEWKICVANLASSTISPICLNNAAAATGVLGADYALLSKAPDGNGRRYLIMLSNGDGVTEGMAGTFSFKPGDTTLTFEGLGPVRTDRPDNTKYAPTCIGISNPQFCIQTPHADLVQIGGNGGRAALIGDGTYDSTNTSNWILSHILSASTPGLVSDSGTWEELGGGEGIGGFQGGYVGCSALSPICVQSNYYGYAALSGRSMMTWTSLNCTSGSCTATCSAAPGLANGTSILIGQNTVGIPWGTVATISGVSGATYSFTAGTVTGSGTGYAIVNETLGASNWGYMAIGLVRYFNNGRQFVAAPFHRAMSFDGYSDYPKPAISQDGSMIAWGSNNSIPFASWFLVASTGLGSPRADDQLTGPGTAVSAVPSSTSVEFRFIAPSSSTSCTAYASLYRDMSSAASATVASGAWRGISVTGLTSATPYYWRVACGINEARGVVVTR